MIKKINLRDYQFAPAKFALEKDIAVLALAPNSGKSEISIYVISEYLRQNKGAKVLFMPHATNVLLDNILSRMADNHVDFTYSDDLTQDVQVHVKLPHHVKELKNKKYDFIVVDEAHEHYHAKRMQQIIKACNPKKQLLLTGTPEGFIRRGGYDIFPLAANDIAEKWFAKLNVELVASNYKWNGHYNAKQNIDGQFKFYKDDSQKTLESVVLTLLERVKGNLTADEFNKIKIIPTIKSWFKVSKTIGKTLITCQRTIQADQIYKILKDQGVNVGVSHSKSDLESEEVAKFKRGEYDIMVVVNRAKLGYSDDDLMNVIDMSGTHNPSLIYQTFSRALRGKPEQQKYYLKVTPQGEGQMDLTHMSVCAALMLTDKKYLSTYNGRNFNGIVIPVKKVKKSGSGSGGSGSKKKKDKVVFPDFSNDVIDMFKNIVANMDKSASIYKAVTIGEARKLLDGRKAGDEHIQLAKKHKLDAVKWKKYWKRNNLGEDGYFKTPWDCSLFSGMKVSEWNKLILGDDYNTKPSGYWDYERCKAEAKKYETITEFKRGCIGAYAACQRNNWIRDLCGHMPRQATNYEKSFEFAEKEAQKYKNTKDFRENAHKTYKRAKKCGWLPVITKKMAVVRAPNGHWNSFENCEKESEKYKKRSEFMKGSIGAYRISVKNGWIDSFFPKKKAQKA
jgi:superfamily II DNA or RNA helicase